MTTALALSPQNLPADRNPALVYLAGLESPGSRITMRRGLNRIAGMLQPELDFISFPWASLRYQHTAAIRSKLAESYSAATANLYLSAMRGVLKECWRLGMLPVEEYQRAIDLGQIKGEKAKQAEKGRHLSFGELAALITACKDGTPLGARDAAMLCVGYTCGLRRAEIVGLSLADYDQTDGRLTIRKGKGNKERIVNVVGAAKDALDDWLALRGNWAGAIFPQVRRGGHIIQTGLSGQAFYDMLAERARQAGVKDFSPHDLRRTFAGDLLDTGADLVTVQKLMGHSDVKTTAGYDRRDNRAKLDAQRRLHVPYTR